MARAIWRGNISFGLVTIPVGLYSAENKRDIAFHMLDKRNHTPVKQKRVNAETGQEVPWDDVVKGFEYEEGQYIEVTPEELSAADPEVTNTIDIFAVVKAEEIEPRYYDKPYYLEPQKAGRKAYALLREAFRRAGYVAIARVVIRTRQYVCALMPEGPLLLCDILRYAYELRDPADLDLPSEDLAKEGINDRELQMAEQLVNAMVAPFEPETYEDTYHNRVLELIAEKAKTGTIPVSKPTAQPEAAEVVDIMSLLKKSVAQAEKGKPKRERQTARA